MGILQEPHLHHPDQQQAHQRGTQQPRHRASPCHELRATLRARAACEAPACVARACLPRVAREGEGRGHEREGEAGDHTSADCLRLSLCGYARPSRDRSQSPASLALFAPLGRGHEACYLCYGELGGSESILSLYRSCPLPPFLASPPYVVPESVARPRPREERRELRVLPLFLWYFSYHPHMTHT